MKKGIIFDLDGTLWDTCKAVVDAWNKVLDSKPDVHVSITIEDMKGFMGKTLDVIAKMILPDIDEARRKEIFDECCKEEHAFLRANGGILYPDLEETLKKLQNEYSLYIVSNCQDGYIQTFLDHYDYWKYFKDIEMAGRTGKTKGENIKLVIERNNIDKAVYVGDTRGDFEGARYANIPFIYAKYGFGDVEEPDYVINEFKDLLEVLITIR